MRRPCSLLAVCLVAVAGLCALPVPARGDGDPASDYLVSQPVFVPFAKGNPSLRLRLIATTQAAKSRGFEIRVAVIQSATDLGAAPQLLGMPKAYARLLGAELHFAYKGRLLVVMPDGFGYTSDGATIPGSADLLATLPKPAGNTPDQLVAAAITATRAIARDAGHPLPPHLRLGQTAARPPQSGSRALALAVELVLGGILVAAAIRLIVRRRHRDAM